MTDHHVQADPPYVASLVRSRRPQPSPNAPKTGVWVPCGRALPTRNCGAASAAVVAAHRPQAPAPLCEAVGLEPQRPGVRFSARGCGFTGGSQQERKRLLRNMNLFNALCSDMASADVDVVAASAAQFVASTAVVPDS